MLLTDGGDFGNLETEEMKASAIFAANTTLLAMERNCGNVEQTTFFCKRGHSNDGSWAHQNTFK